MLQWEDSRNVSYILKCFACKHFVALQIFIDCFLNNLIRKSPVIIRIRFQPVAGKLFVEGGLTMAWFISFSRPETRAIRSQHLITDHQISFFIQTEFKLGVCNDDSAV